MPILTLPFGEGLDRASGRMVVSPVSYEDLRNVHLFKGKAFARNGLTDISTLQDDGPTDLDVTVMLASLRSENSAIGVGYNTNATSNREVWANRLDIDGTNPLAIGQLGTLSTVATFTPPIIIGADSDERFFFAHDEPLFSARFKTQIYDPFTSPQVQDLQADLDGNGLADVYFRGVVRHLSYIFGWGFGSDSDRVRGDMVRVSDSGDTTKFRDEGFFEAGQKGEPVMVCRTAGKNLMVFKETETHAIFGYSPDTFGILPSDTQFGCVGSRLAITIGRTTFFWSVQGPRLTTGGESEDIEVPLDIGGPDPAGLVAESDPADAFAEYDPENRVVVFVWGQRVYALSIKDPNRPRWSYYELGETAQCGGQFYSTQSQAGIGGAPTGAPENLTFPVIAPTSVDILFDNVSQTGGERVEIHRSEDGGTSYVLHSSTLANDLATQTIQVTGLDPLTDYKFSLRYIRSAQYAPGYTDPDPDLWDTPTFDSQGSTTTIATAPSIVTRSGSNNGLWDRTAPAADQITIAFTVPAGHESLDIEIDRQIVSDGDAGTQDLGGGTGAPDTADVIISAFALLTTLIGGGTGYVDLVAVDLRHNQYRIRFKNGTNFSAYSNTPRCWAGPDLPNDLILTSLPGEDMSAAWQNATTPTDSRSCPAVPPAQHQTEAWVKNDTDASVWVLEGTVPPYSTGIEVFMDIPTQDPGDIILVAIRHKVTVCGATDYSKFSPTEQMTVQA